MPVRGNTFKIFCGNLSDDATSQELRKLFEEHGTVVEADVVEQKNFGFVHMEKSKESKAAIDALKGHVLHGREMVVEASTGSRRGEVNQRTKIFVGNLHKDTKVQELRDLFEGFGDVQEADILTNYAFVHMSMETEAHQAIKELDGFELHGMRLRVQQSTSVVRKRPGMGNSDACYRCGSSGHWSKECPHEGPRGMRGGPSFADRGRQRSGGRFDPYPPPPPGYMRDRMMRSYREDPFDRFDRMERPSDRGLDSLYGRRPAPRMYDDMFERRPAPPLPPAYLDFGRRSPPQSRYPPPPPSMMRGRSPPPPMMRGRSPPPPMMRGRSPPPPMMRGRSPPPPMMRERSPPPPMMRGRSPPATMMRGRSPPPPMMRERSPISMSMMRDRSPLHSMSMMRERSPPRSMSMMRERSPPLMRGSYGALPERRPY